MKKLAVIGRGTVGCMASLQLRLNYPDSEIDWYFDPNIKPQSVGEGTTLALPIVLNNTLNFSPKDYPLVDGYVKTGIYKDGWSESGNDFTHDFPSPNVALHFNATKLQDYVFNRVKDYVNVIPKNIDAENIDADHVIDCSGRPKTFERHHMSSFIPVNSVHVTQCYWDGPRFSHTLTIARPYGWVFGIPLQNRCSIGYLYNKDINTLEEVKEDVKAIFSDYNLEPSEDTNSFSFSNYYKKTNYTDHISYNGNASFFLEPLEALTFGMANAFLHNSMNVIDGGMSLEEANREYVTVVSQCEKIIMMHYFAGSKYNTKFWDYARERGEACMSYAKYDQAFIDMISSAQDAGPFGTYPERIVGPTAMTKEMAHLKNIWWTGSFVQNLNGLGIRDKLEQTLGIIKPEAIAAE